MPSSWPRRTFLRSTAVAGLGLALATTFPHRAAAATTTDPFATVRAQWADLTSGGAIDATNPVYATALANLSAKATTYLSLLEASSTSAQLFSDLALDTNSANVTASFNRLETLALAYVTPGTAYTGNASVLAAVTSGLDYMTTSVYS
ncbi:hypothetical protein ABH932_007668, partial [Streptacidiphilus sp. MAP5-52]